MAASSHQVRKIRLGGTIPRFVLVDAEDYEYLNQWKWAYASGYAKRQSTTRNGVKSKVILMHREIMGVDDKTIHIDHINRKPLDNRKANLRVATSSQNIANSKLYRTNKTGYRGVCYIKRENKYRASISVNNKRIQIGQFGTALEAAQAYRDAAVQYFGVFASNMEIQNG